MGLLEQYNFGTSPELLFCPIHLRSNTTTTTCNEQQQEQPQQLIEQNKEVLNNKSNFMIETNEYTRKYAYDPILRLSDINYVDRYEGYFDTIIESIDQSNLVKKNVLEYLIINDQVVDTINSNTKQQALTIDNFLTIDNA